MAGSLAGRVALVTGASSGIGAATAVALGAAGASVAAVARRAERLRNTVCAIEAAGGTGIALAGDVAQESVASDVVAQAIGRFGRLDILVNSAGVIQAEDVAAAVVFIVGSPARVNISELWIRATADVAY